MIANLCLEVVMVNLAIFSDSDDYKCACSTILES